MKKRLLKKPPLRLHQHYSILLELRSLFFSQTHSPAITKRDVCFANSTKARDVPRTTKALNPTHYNISPTLPFIISLIFFQMYCFGFILFLRTNINNISKYPYSSLTNKCIFFIKHIKIYIKIQTNIVLHVSVFDHDQGAFTEPG
jgi:hypothetical protein